MTVSRTNLYRGSLPSALQSLGVTVSLCIFDTASSHDPSVEEVQNVDITQGRMLVLTLYPSVLIQLLKQNASRQPSY